MTVGAWLINDQACVIAAIPIRISQFLSDRLTLRVTGADGESRFNILALDEDDVLGEFPASVQNIYQLMIDYRRHREIPLVHASINVPGITATVLAYSGDPDDTNTIGRIVDLFSLWEARTADVGGEFHFEQISIPVVNREILSAHVVRTRNKRLRRSIERYHIRAVVEEYSELRRPEEAEFHGRMALTYSREPPIESANNLGYLFMSVKDLDEAERLFEIAVTLEDAPRVELALPHYNLGILHAQRQRYGEAIKEITISIDNIRDANEAEKACRCLFIPRLNADGAVEFVEIWDPDLLSTAEKALDILSTIHPN